jgi:hypothetical protein
MNVNQIDTADIKRFKYSERLNTRSIFSDEIKEYENWWNNYNVIKPDKFLRESIREHDFHYEKIP